MSNLIRKTKKDYIYVKNVNCDSFRELFCLSNQMMGKFGDTVLPSNISSVSLPDKFSEFFLLVRLDRLEAALTLTGQSPLTLLSSLGLSLQNFSLYLMNA